MKALVVGAGSVGQVFAYFLKRSGAEVYFYVKEKYRADAEQGFKIFSWNQTRGGRPAELSLRPDGVLSTPGELSREKWDQVYFCMSSTGLRGAWLPGFLASIGSATLVTLQPSPGDRALILESLSEAQLVSGVISLISYPAPLPGEMLAPGTAFWLPPLTANPFSGGDPKRVQEVVRQLKQGGLPSKVTTDVGRSHAHANAALMALIGVLEKADWRLKEVRTKENLELLKSAAQVAFASTQASVGTKPPFALQLLLSKPGLAWVSWAAPKLFPFDVESYLRVHFTKVGDQTRLALKLFSENAKKANIPSAALDALITALH